MPITQVGSQTNTGNSANVTSRAPAVPAGAQADDVAIVFLDLWQTATTITPPAGFTLLTGFPTTGGSGVRNYVYWKRLTGADTGTYSFTWGASNWTTASCIMLRGVKLTGDPIGSNYNTAYNTSTTFPSVTVAPSYTPALVWHGYNDSAGTHTPPTGYTETSDVDCGTSAIDLTGATLTASGATVSVSSPNFAVLLAVEEQGPTEGGYILQEDGFKIRLEDGTGFLIMEEPFPADGFAVTGQTDIVSTATGAADVSGGGSGGGTVTLTAGTPFQATGSVTSGVVNLPAGLTTGDYTFLFCTLNASSGSITGPAGWSTALASEQSTASTSHVTAIYYRDWQSGDTDPTVTCSSGRLAVLPVQVSGADTSNPIEGTVGSTSQASATTSVDAPSQTSVTSELLVTAHAGRSSTNGVFITWTPPSGMTELGEAGGQAAAATNASIEVAFEIITAGATTGARTATASSTATGSRGVSMLMKAAPGGGGTQIPVDGTIEVTSTTTGAATGRMPAASTIAVVSTITGTATVLAPVLGAVSVTSAATGTAEIGSNLSVNGTVTITTTTTGTAAARTATTGTIAATTASTGTANGLRPTTGTTPVTTAGAGAATLRAAAAGTIPVTSLVSGTSNTLEQAAGTATVTTTTSGTVAVRQPTTGTTPITSTTSGTVQIGGAFTASGTMAVTTTTTGTVTSRQGATATVTVVSANTGTTGQRHAAVGVITATTSSTGTTGQRHAAASTIAIVTAISGEVGQTAAVAGTVTITTTVAGTAINPSAYRNITFTGSVWVRDISGSITARTIQGRPTGRVITGTVEV